MGGIVKNVVRVVMAVLIGLALFCGPGACSKEEIRRNLPAERSF